MSDLENFIYDIKTKIYFGKGSISHLSEAVRPYGKKALLVYGGGSIKRIGLYDEAVKQLEEAGVSIVELSGVQPNPKIESVREGVRLCRENDVDVVVAIGGGSTIDAAKVIAGSVSYEGDPWDIVLDAGKVVSVLPIISVLTLTATGSEMDVFAVISDMEKNEKWGTGHPDFRPKASILDPTYTFSVSAYQTAAGTADMMSHIMENYFSNVEGYMQDRMAEALLSTCVKYGIMAVKEPENYEARANLMWCGSWAINDLLNLGKPCAWSVHPMEHELSAFYDITHGVGLAILTPHWMERVLDDQSVDKFVELACNVWHVDATGKGKFEVAREGIRRTADYFRSMGIPMTLHEVGIDETYFDIMAQKACEGMKGAYRELSADDVKAIFKAAL